jgi:hypothetical protein
LLIRLSDGAVLSSAPGQYWRTGGAMANHIDEGAVWSPNSRFANGRSKPCHLGLDRPVLSAFFRT